MSICSNTSACALTVHASPNTGCIYVAVCSSASALPAGWPSDRDALLAMPGWTEFINTDTSTMSGTGDYEAVNEISESQQTYCTFGRRCDAMFLTCKQLVTSHFLSIRTICLQRALTYMYTLYVPVLILFCNVQSRNTTRELRMGACCRAPTQWPSTGSSMTSRSTRTSLVRHTFDDVASKVYLCSTNHPPPHCTHVYMLSC